MNSVRRRSQCGAALLMLLLIFGILGAVFAMRGIGTNASRQISVADTNKILKMAIDALIGYAASHTQSGPPLTRPYLPCPDKTAAAGLGTANDGQEDRNLVTGACVVQEGNFPWVTLGLPGTDAWGNRLRYIVTPAFSNSVTGMQLTDVGTLTINDSAGANLATALPVVVLSHGPNGWGATSGNGQIIGLPPVTNTNERENTDNDVIFVSSAEVATGGPGGEFDDVSIWLTSTALFASMQQAGKL